MIESFQGQELDAHYLGFFDWFNRQLFYEAQDVLEDLWLKDKHGVDANVYKGLIQLAGAFVHLQKTCCGPQPRCSSSRSQPEEISRKMEREAGTEEGRVPLQPINEPTGTRSTRPPPWGLGGGLLQRPKLKAPPFGRG